MSSANKILILFCALAAFGIGAAINSARVSDQIDTQALLTAELLVSHEPEQSATVSSVTTELTLVNFWASWCSPCKEEMPIFEAMYRQHKKADGKGFGIVGIAIDIPEKAQPFLDSMDISYPILYAERTGMEIMESAGNPQGLMPYSLLLDKNGKVLDQVLGKIDEQQISAWIAEHL